MNKKYIIYSISQNFKRRYVINGDFDPFHNNSSTYNDLIATFDKVKLDRLINYYKFKGCWMGNIIEQYNE